MSVCDRCYKPGHCCTGFALFTKQDVERTFWMDGDGTVEAFLQESGLPFTPELLERHSDEASGRDYGSYQFSCGHLDGHGRCGIYESRPAACRNFEAGGGSPLCIHSHGAEGTGDGL